MTIEIQHYTPLGGGVRVRWVSEWPEHITVASDDGRGGLELSVPVADLVRFAAAVADAVAVAQNDQKKL